MIGQMDRRAKFYNPVVIKSASAGTTNLWAEWDNVWCRIEQPSGFKSDAGSQDNLVLNADITIRYSLQAQAFLSKDTKILVRGRYYQVTDYQIDVRQEFITIRTVSKIGGSTAQLPIATETVEAIYKVITVIEAGAGNNFTFIVPEVINKTLLTIETGRAIPIGIVYNSDPGPREIKFTAATGTFTVNAEAPLIAGEDFRIIYK